MYFFLILFFISLFGIVLMIGRRLVFAEIKKDEHTEKFILETFDLNKLKHLTVKNSKKYGFIIFVNLLRFYIKSSYVIKNWYKDIKSKTKSLIHKYLERKHGEPKEKEVSSFLKMVSDYKYKIREIKDKIKEEEGIQ